MPSSFGASDTAKPAICPATAAGFGLLASLIMSPIDEKAPLTLPDKSRSGMGRGAGTRTVSVSVAVVVAVTVSKIELGACVTVTVTGEAVEDNDDVLPEPIVESTVEEDDDEIDVEVACK